MKLQMFISRVYALASEVGDLISDGRGAVSIESSPPMFSSRYIAQFSTGLWHEPRQGLRAAALPTRQFFVHQAWVIVLQILSALVLAGLCMHSRQIPEKSESLRFLAERPFALGITVSVVFLSGFYTSLSPSWHLLMRVFGWIGLARVIGVLTIRASYRRLI